METCRHRITTGFRFTRTQLPCQTPQVFLQQVKLSKSNPGGDTLLRGIFHTKNLDEILASVGGPQFSLKRTLNAFNITLIGIGAIIGAGIFATVGTAASGTPERAGAGPSLMLSFVITAIVCGFTALCYAELASMVPISGSAYTAASGTPERAGAGPSLMLSFVI